MALPLLNGRAYDWSQVAVRPADGVRPFFGITAITYEDEQDIEKNYGFGNMPYNYGMGNIDCKGTLTLYMEELEAMQQTSPTGRIQDYGAFDLVVSFLHPTRGAVHHVLKNVILTKNSRELQQNAKSFTIEVPFICSHIEWI